MPRQPVVPPSSVACLGNGATCATMCPQEVHDRLYGKNARTHLLLYRSALIADSWNLPPLIG
eukprot:2189461-Amphidinium_carterae.1